MKTQINRVTLQATMNSMKYRKVEREVFENPFGKPGQCQLHGNKAKTLVNGICQGCSSSWNRKKVQDFLQEAHARRAVPSVTTKLVK